MTHPYMRQSPSVFSMTVNALLLALVLMLCACGGGGGSMPSNGDNGGGGQPGGDEPDGPYVFAPVDAMPGGRVVSNVVVVQDLDAQASVSVDDGMLEIDNGTGFTDQGQTGTVNNGDRIRIRTSAADTVDTARTIVFSLGSITRDFTVTARDPAFAIETVFKNITFRWNAALVHEGDRFRIFRSDVDTGGLFIPFSDPVTAPDGELQLPVASHLMSWNQTRFRLGVCDAADDCRDIAATEIVAGNADSITVIGQLKNDAPDVFTNAAFGHTIELSSDGHTLASGAFQALPEGASYYGQAFVFRNNAGTWQQADELIDPLGGDRFGFRIALSADGSLAAVAVPGFARCPNVPGDYETGFNACADAGAVVVFERLPDNSYGFLQRLQGHNTETDDTFGAGLDMSADGNVIVVSAIDEKNCTSTGPDNQDYAWNAGSLSRNDAALDDDVCSGSGAVYVFRRSVADGHWSQTAYIKDNSATADQFAMNIALSADGARLVTARTSGPVSAIGVYRWTPIVDLWLLEQEIPPPDGVNPLGFGTSIAISGDGKVIAAFAGDDSCAEGVNSTSSDNTCVERGAVYVYERDATTWTASAYIKPTVGMGELYNFGIGSYWANYIPAFEGLSLNEDGTVLAVGSRRDGSCAAGIGGDRNDAACGSIHKFRGVVHVYKRADVSQTWQEIAYLKPKHSLGVNEMGVVRLDASGTTLTVGAWREGSCKAGFDPEPGDLDCINTGAIYIY